jgi:hypothetical protein
MNLREELVTLISNGTPTADIYEFLLKRLKRPSIISLLKSSGVEFPLPPTGDDITDARRLELQLLSISE